MLENICPKELVSGRALLVKVVQGLGNITTQTANPIISKREIPEVGLHMTSAVSPSREASKITQAMNNGCFDSQCRNTIQRVLHCPLAD